MNESKNGNFANNRFSENSDNENFSDPRFLNGSDTGLGFLDDSARDTQK